MKTTLLILLILELGLLVLAQDEYGSDDVGTGEYDEGPIESDDVGTVQRRSMTRRSQNAPWPMSEEKRFWGKISNFLQGAAQKGLNTLGQVSQGYNGNSLMGVVGKPQVFYGSPQQVGGMVGGMGKRKGKCGNPSTFTAAQVQEAVTSHNMFRSKEKEASDMMSLSYRDDLAARAQELSDRCIWEHDLTEMCDGEGLGQNMFIEAASSGFPALNVTKAVESWYNEKPDYHYDTTKCNPGKMCGHYTQVVWAKTTTVGCGATKCASINMHGKPWKNALLVVCDYAAQGNWVGEKIYQKGSQCSQCPFTGSGIACVQGLCTPCQMGKDSGCTCKFNSQCSGNGKFDSSACACKCNKGFFGTECENSCACEDTKGFEQACPQWASNCPNPAYKEFLSDKCKKTCGWCETPPGVC